MRCFDEEGLVGSDFIFGRTDSRYSGGGENRRIRVKDSGEKRFIFFWRHVGDHVLPILIRFRCVGLAAATSKKSIERFAQLYFDVFGRFAVIENLALNISSTWCGFDFLN